MVSLRLLVLFLPIPSIAKCTRSGGESDRLTGSVHILFLVVNGHAQCLGTEEEGFALVSSGFAG